MTYVVAIIEDATFEDPHVIIGMGLDHLAMAVSSYLREARPQTSSGRLELSDPPQGKAWLDHIWEALDDVDDIRLTVYSTTGSMMPVGSFIAWIEANRDKLEFQHRAAVVNVVDAL